MAFFNLTQLGVQEPIQTAVKDEHILYTIQNNRAKPAYTSLSSERSALTPLPKSADGSRSSASHQGSSDKSIVKDVSDAKGSYVRYTERLTKHQRSKYAPNEVYRKPVISSQDYGWHQTNENSQSMPWTHVDRHAKVNSEMTRFVDEMTLTNKHFTLF